MSKSVKDVVFRRKVAEASENRNAQEESYKKIISLLDDC